MSGSPANGARRCRWMARDGPSGRACSGRTTGAVHCRPSSSAVRSESRATARWKLADLDPSARRSSFTGGRRPHRPRAPSPDERARPLSRHGARDLEPVDFIGACLTGRIAATPASMVLSWLTDNRRGASGSAVYDPELIRLAGRDPAVLPPLQPTGSVLGPLTDAAAAELELRQGCRSSAGCRICTPPISGRARSPTTRAISRSARRHGSPPPCRSRRPTCSVRWPRSPASGRAPT